MKKVAIICPIYNTFPEIVSSMINQTYTNWELLLIHDGPNSTSLEKLITAIGDNRIKYIETKERRGQWGHPIRQTCLRNIDLMVPDAEYVVITNGDNHHVPHFLEYLINGFDSDTLVTYCSQFVHGYESWQKTSIIENMQTSFKNMEWEVYKYGIIDTRLQLGYIDIACIVVKKEVAKAIGWNSFEHSSDWEFMNEIMVRYGADKWKLVRGCLISHN